MEYVCPILFTYDLSTLGLPGLKQMLRLSLMAYLTVSNMKA